MLLCMYTILKKTIVVSQQRILVHSSIAQIIIVTRWRARYRTGIIVNLSDSMYLVKF